MPGQVYAITFSAVTASAAQDLFEVTAPAAGTVAIHGIVLGQTSDHGDAAAEALQLRLIRGFTVSGSVGTAATPAPQSSKSAAAAAAAEVNNTTLANTTATVDLLVDAWNIQAGYQIWFPPEVRPILRNSERVVLRQSAPLDAITQSGTMYVSEE